MILLAQRRIDERQEHRERDAKLEQEETVTGKGVLEDFSCKAKFGIAGMWMQKGRTASMLTYGIELITWK